MAVLRGKDSVGCKGTPNVFVFSDEGLTPLAVTLVSPKGPVPPHKVFKMGILLSLPLGLLWGSHGDKVSLSPHRGGP